ncbi:MAG: hypothetical protein GTN53_16705, partial [Candidatus Aminicenantes bacterium]|nr:hypothetical protein [Candidatus Aminicenantes bacterium]NIQ68094.1 hypothetical protein [Candidatus Aminicenantes bacterium]NIT24137.1 hypothetical protein [Candidatus Aminicenantes bacterium]
ESFRTSFELIVEQPVQRIHPVKDIHFAVEYYDLDTKTFNASDTEPGTQEDNLQILANMMKNFVRPFDLSRQPLLRAGLVEIDRNRYVLT